MVSNWFDQNASFRTYFVICINVSHEFAPHFEGKTMKMLTAMLLFTLCFSLVTLTVDARKVRPNYFMNFESVGKYLEMSLNIFCVISAIFLLIEVTVTAGSTRQILAKALWFKTNGYDMNFHYLLLIRL